MNSHRVWGSGTPQDWRKRPEAEVKLPRDPTEAPTGRGSGGMWDSIWMIVFFLKVQRGPVVFGEFVYYKNLECIC